MLAKTSGDTPSAIESVKDCDTIRAAACLEVSVSFTCLFRFLLRARFAASLTGLTSVPGFRAAVKFAKGRWVIRAHTSSSVRSAYDRRVGVCFLWTALIPEISTNRLDDGFNRMTISRIPYWLQQGGEYVNASQD